MFVDCRHDRPLPIHRTHVVAFEEFDGALPKAQSLGFDLLEAEAVPAGDQLEVGPHGARVELRAGHAAGLQQVAQQLVLRRRGHISEHGRHQRMQRIFSLHSFMKVR